MITKPQELQIENAKFAFKPNFSGFAGKFNNEGERNFDILIESQKEADELAKLGWNIKQYQNKNREDSEPIYFLHVKVKFGDVPPKIWCYEEGQKARKLLTEETCYILDEVPIVKMDVIINPYHWTMPSGKEGITAYLKTMWATIGNNLVAKYEFPEEDSMENAEKDIPF